MRKIFIIILTLFSSLYSTAQSGYEITINIKNYTDTLAYLTFYRFDKTLIQEKCTNITNGKIVFKGNSKLEKGIYSLISQQKVIMFDFFIDDETQVVALTADLNGTVVENLKSVNSQRQNDFFSYVNYIGKQNKDFINLKQKTVLKTKNDTIALAEIQNKFERQIVDYEENFILKNKGTFIADVMNIKTERILKEVSKAANGRPDSLMIYKYYKTHYWDLIDFKDDATMRNPFFANKLKKYFDQVVPFIADSVTVEIDRLLSKTVQGSLLYKLMLANFTYTYETSKIMGFDKVFVHIVDTYFKTGKANGIYDDPEVVQKIIKRAEKLRPVLIGTVALDLSMIKAEDFNKMKAMGFENAKNSEEMTKVFYANVNEVNKMWVKLSDIKADYTILVFWDVDCGHCQTEIPKLVKAYNDLLLEKKNVKVYSVYMQHEGEKYLKYIADNTLPFINVYDGAHYNNAIEKYDVYSTPVIYILDKNKIIKAKRIDADKVTTFIKAMETETKIRK